MTTTDVIISKQAVMSLVKQLELTSASLVVSDTEPMFDSQYLHLLTHSAQNNINFVNDFNEDNNEHNLEEDIQSTEKALLLDFSYE